MTLAKLIAERRAKIEAFERDTRVDAFHDISEVNDLIERTPIASKADALAAMDLSATRPASQGTTLSWQWSRR
jgi:hypothetical protein